MAGHRPIPCVEIVSDDMPFIVDSVTMELGRQGYGIDLVIHPVIWVRRDSDGQLIEVLEPGAAARPDAQPESILHVEVARETDREALGAAVREGRARARPRSGPPSRTGRPMRERTRAPDRGARLRSRRPVDADERAEAKAFLGWLADNHFTFLGYREYELIRGDEEMGLKAVADSGLGILRGAAGDALHEAEPEGARRWPPRRTRCC